MNGRVSKKIRKLVLMNGGNDMTKEQVKKLTRYLGKRYDEGLLSI